MKIFLILSKRILVSLFLITVLLVLIVARFAGSAILNNNGDTHKKRNDFISNLGYRIDEENISVKEIIIPYVFTNEYNKYNNIQKTAGYDLERFKGNKVTLYTYYSNDDFDNEIQINLLVFNGEIIGGDIRNVDADIEYLPLVKQRKNG